MKKIGLLILLFVISMVGRSQLLTEPFNYTPSATLGLETQSSGVWVHVNTGDSILVTSGSLTYPNLATSTGNKVAFDGAGTDYYSTFTTQSTGSVYCSFILNVSSLGSLNTTGGYFNALVQGATTTSFGAAVWTRLSTTPGKFNVGISTRSNSVVSWLATDLTPGTPCFIVSAYDMIAGTANDVARIWLNTPNIGGSEPAADATAAVGTDLLSVGRVLLRQDAAATTPFIEVDEMRVGTSWVQVTPSSAAVPTLTATALTAFGNVCTNTTAGPNSFTITGTTLDATNVTVGALAGFTYSTSAGGPYTTTLSLTQPGGSYSQQVFVDFNPTAVQSYNGNIPVGGGGATTIQVAASGAGVNTIPSVTSGAAGSITTTTAIVAGSITATGCTAVSAYGIEYSLVNGFGNGTGTPVASGNLSGGNFSSNLSGLTPGTVYYYHAYASNGGGTGYGAQGTFTTIALTPTLSANTLTAFGNVCINTTAGPNSFTITGSALTAANVTVGALAGFTYSIAAGGPYTASLSLTQPGGSYSQQIFVDFNPVAVQSYNGNIPVGGGGASSINVAASGSGVNTAPSVTTGGASAITPTTATLAGSIPSTGCTAISAYGVEYSLINGFGNGTGTPVASGNLSGGNFSSNLSSLTPATIYYYHAYATNGGGTTYGSQQSFTTLAAPPALSSTALAGFGNVCTNTTAGPNSFTITGTNLTAANVTVAALSGFTYSTTAGGAYTASLSLAQPGGSYSQQIFVKFTPTAVQSYNGNIVVGGGGAASAINVAATGSGVNSAPSVTTGAASAITTVSATCAGTITSIGCSAITAYGIEFSLINGFPDGTGTDVASINLSGGNFTSDLSGLSPNTTYYYKAYATNGGGTTYGLQQFFITNALTPTLNATALTPFGAVCTNTVAGPNSFTINGSALNATNINVGPLTGFSFSTTAGGAYTASLSLAQPGGTYTQSIFVKFSPVAVQSYDGLIPVSGGGAAAITVAASGSGVNTAPSVTTGAASAITAISATCAGTIPATGCTAISAYGIEYSTTNGFPNGTGTAVPSGNLAGGNFSSNLSGLAPSTTYYYHAYATNTGGTTYGAQQSFTTATPVLSATALTAFGNVCTNTTAGPNSFTITGTNLTTANVTVGALAGFTYSTTAGGAYTASLSLAQPGGSYSQAIFVKFTPVAVQSYNGNIAVGGGGATAVNVAASGAGINTIATVTTGAASAITSISATCAGTIPATGCTAVTAYGIEYSTTNGFPNGTGTPVASGNLAGGNFTSNLAGLTPSTTYYYHAYATNNGGTAYGAQQSFTTATPVLSANALAAFGNVCLNNAAGPNSFTITGTNLTTANVNVAALPGFTYSTTAGGSYTATLSLVQPSGAYSQQIFVKFTPTAVQSYNGNIVVTGGGFAGSVNVAASGAGINTAASVTTGGASAITQTTATLAGAIPSIGCSAITTYGIEYSTTNGFPNGTGTPVVSGNLAGGNFTSNLAGLTPGTTYYYHAYATNNGGTTYGAQQSFTTAIPVLTATALTGFGAVCINNTAGPNSFTITSNALTNANVNVGPLAGYSFATSAGGTYTASLSLTQPGGAYAQTIYVKFSPVAVQTYNGNIPVSGGGAPTINVAVTGSGINTAATVVTGNATVLSANAAVATGTISSIGCSAVFAYGIEYSGINGFATGTGTQVASANLAGSNFTASLNGLVQNTTYYYRAYAVNNGGIAYGAQQTFTTLGIPHGLVIYSNPISRGGVIHFTLDGIKPGHYAAEIFNDVGQMIYKKDMIIGVNFIDDNLTLPAIFGTGVYSFQIVSPEFRIGKIFMIE